MSLYQKYRPQSFADLTGQEHIVSTLEQAVEQKKLAHAYLFAGPRGTGKTSVARILAKHMLTQGLDAEKTKQLMDQVEEGTAVDLIEIDAASNRRIDDVRALIERIQFSPIHAAAKVYIVDEVHMLTPEAFNALLKTLEEPPEYAYFILATTELQKIPATIQSRCQRFAFREISEDDILRRLQHIVEAEGITTERNALRNIARSAQGGLRDAISLLDQLRSLPQITETDVRERLGRSGREEAETLFAAMNANDSPTMLSVIHDAEESGLSMESLGREVLGLARSWLHQCVAEHTGTDEPSRLIDLVLKALRDLRLSPVPGLVLEHALLQFVSGDQGPSTPPATRLFTPEKTVTPKAADATQERKSAPVKKAEEAPAKAEAVTEKPRAAGTLEAPEFTRETVLMNWLQIAEKAKPAAVKMSLKNGRVSEVEGDTVTLRFSSRFHRDRVADKEALFGIEDLLKEFFKRLIRVKCVMEEETREAVKDDAVNLADVAAEVF